VDRRNLEGKIDTCKPEEGTKHGNGRSAHARSLSDGEWEREIEKEEGSGF